MPRKDYPRTPDGRYFVAKGRLWRCTDPRLGDSERRRLVKQLMQARLAVRNASSEAQAQAARACVDAAKIALGERGPVWWDDNAPDYTNHEPLNTPYAAWWQSRSHPDDDEV
ncbi:MAG: hypothetical protein KKH72_07985 [Alphaproteobacteria bacterium]|nr:hypothetical protein [Alphaproteobacteria bacterium]